MCIYRYMYAFIHTQKYSKYIYLYQICKIKYFESTMHVSKFCTLKCDGEHQHVCVCVCMDIWHCMYAYMYVYVYEFPLEGGSVQIDEVTNTLIYSAIY